MADISSTFRYDGDFGPLRSEIKLLAKDISAINVQFKAFDKNAQQSMLSLASALQRDLASIGNFKTSIVDITSTVDSFGNAVSKSKLTLREYAKEASQAFKSTSNTRKLAEREVAKLQSTLVELGSVGGRKKGVLIKPLTADLSGLSAKTMLARKQFEIFNTLVQDGATKLIDFGKNTQWAGRQLMVGLSLPIALMATNITKAFLDVEKELTRFSKVYGSDLTSTTKQATESMKAQVLSLSQTIAKEYGIAAKETAGLAADLAATGLEGQRLLKTVEQTTKLAVLGEVDRQEAMKATLSLQTAFNMSTKQLADSVNFLNSVENQTSTSLQDLVTAIPKTGPVINALGGDIKDLSVLLVAMKEGGVDAGEGANAIKSGLASLINPTKKASEVAKQYGIDIEKLVQSTRGELMPTIMGFQKALSGLDSFGRAQVIEQIFGKYQFARISALFDNLNKEGSQTKKILELSTMSAIDLAKQAYREMQTLQESAPVRMQRAMESLKAELLPLGATIAENITPIISKFADIVGNIVDFLEKLPSPTKNFLKITAAVTALLGPIVMLVGLFANFGGNVVKLTMNFVNMVRAMAGIKTGRFQMLSDEQLAAKLASDKLTQSFESQEGALNKLNASLQIYMAKLSQLSQTRPGLFNPTPMTRRASGGYISGPGGPTDDKIPALLSNGEYVIKASSVNKYGKQTLDDINAGKYANGGIVGLKRGGNPAVAAIMDIFSLIGGTRASSRYITRSGQERTKRSTRNIYEEGASPYESISRYSTKRSSRTSGFYDNEAFALGRPNSNEVIGHIFTPSFMKKYGPASGGSAPRISGANMPKGLIGSIKGNEIYDILPNSYITITKDFNKKLVSPGTATGRDWLESAREPRHFISVTSELMKAGLSKDQALSVSGAILDNMNKYMYANQDKTFNDQSFGRIFSNIASKQISRSKFIANRKATGGPAHFDIGGIAMAGMGIPISSGFPSYLYNQSSGQTTPTAAPIIRQRDQKLSRKNASVSGILGLLAAAGPRVRGITASATERYLRSSKSRYQGYGIDQFFGSRAKGAKGNVDIAAILSKPISARTNEEKALVQALEAHASGEFGDKNVLRNMSEKDILAGSQSLQAMLAQYPGNTVRLYRAIRTGPETADVTRGHYGYTTKDVEPYQPFLSFSHDLHKILKFANASSLGQNPRIIEMDVPKSAIVGIQGVNYAGHTKIGSEGEFIVRSAGLPKSKRYINLSGFSAYAHEGSEDKFLSFLTAPMASGERDFLISDILNRVEGKRPMFLEGPLRNEADEYLKKRSEAYMSPDRESKLFELEKDRKRIFGVTSKEIVFLKKYMEDKYGMPFSELKKVKHDKLFKSKYDSSIIRDSQVRRFLSEALGYSRSGSRWYESSYSPGAMSSAFSTDMISRASGGKVYGEGGPTEDKIPAMLSNGEYVIKASSVKKYGLDFMDNLNAGRYAYGGMVKKLKYGGNPGETEMTHVTSPTMSTPADILGSGINIREKMQVALLELQKFIDMYGAGAVEIKLLSNLVVDLPAQLNQKLKDVGVTSQQFATEFKSIGLQKWIPALQQSGVSITEAKKALELLDVEVLSAAKDFDHIDDTNLPIIMERAMKRVKSMDSKFGEIIEKFEALGKSTNSMRVKMNLTAEEIAVINPSILQLGNAIRLENGSLLRLNQMTEKLNNESYQAVMDLNNGNRRRQEQEFRDAGLDIIPYVPKKSGSDGGVPSGARPPKGIKSSKEYRAWVVSQQAAAAGMSEEDFRRTRRTLDNVTNPRPTPSNQSDSEKLSGFVNERNGGQGGGQAVMNAMFSIQSLGYTLGSLASSTDKGTKAINMFMAAMEAMWVLGSVKSMAGGLKLKNLRKQVRPEDMTDEVKGIVDSKLGGKLFTGLGGKMQMLSLKSAEKAASLSTKIMAREAAGKTGIVTNMMKKGQSLLTKAGPMLTRLGPLLSNPYVLAGAAAVAAIGGITYYFIQKHKQMLKKVKDQASSAFTDAKEAAKMYGAELKTVNTVLEENRRLTGEINIPGKKKPIVGQEDLTKLVKTDYKNFVSTIKDAALGTEAQNELSIAYQNMIAQGLQPQAVEEILGEVARQAGRSVDFSAFMKSVFFPGNEDSHMGELRQTMSDRLSGSIRTAMQIAADKYNGEAESTAVAEKFIGGINTAILMGAEDITGSQKAITSIFEYAVSMAAINPEIKDKISQNLISLFTGLGMAADSPLVKQALADPLSNLSMYVAEAINAGAKASDLERIYKEKGEIGLQYLAADFTARKEAQQRNAEFATNAITILQNELKEENKVYEKRKTALDNMTNAENEYHKNIMDNYADRKDQLQDEIDDINKNTDAYIKSLDKKKTEEDFYARQRQTTIEAMKAFAEGDVFGFLQARQNISAQAGEYGIQSEIDRIESTRDAAVAAREEEIKSIEDAERAEDTRHEKRLAQITQWKNATIAAQNQINTKINEAIDDLSAFVNADITQQEKLIVKLQNDFVGKDGKSGVLGTINKNSQFFKDEDKTALDERIKNLKGSFSKVGDVFASGIQAGISTAAKTLGVDEETLKSVLLQSLGASFSNELPGVSPTSYPGSAPANAAPLTEEEKTMLANAEATPLSKEEKAMLAAAEATPLSEEEKAMMAGASGGKKANTKKRPTRIMVRGNANGGYISGPGGPKSDLIPAMLSNGEYVVNAAAVARMGVATMDRINSLGFALGGYAAPNYSPPTPRRFANGGLNSWATSNNTYSIIINANGADANEVYRKFEKELQRYENASDMSRRI